MKAVLLAGGLGTRLREETEFRPKPMIEIGGRPILWHIMKNLSTFGIHDFIIATGYKSEIIKDYFLHYDSWNNDFTVSLGKQNNLKVHSRHDESEWTVTVAYTGEETLTGGRVLLASKYLENEPFLVTYGDGLADVRIDHLIQSHTTSGALATVTTVQPFSRFGVMDVELDGTVKSFSEKPKLEGWINIGFFIFEPGVLSFLKINESLEREPLEEIARGGGLHAFRHEGFWQPMDTVREYKLLNELWESGHAPWKQWQ